MWRVKCVQCDQLQFEHMLRALVSTLERGERESVNEGLSLL